MADSKQPNVTMETGPVICGRCRREMPSLVIEEIGGFSQLCGSDLLFQKVEATCRHCGNIFRWSIREKDIDKMTVIYEGMKEQLERFNGYTPE